MKTPEAIGTARLETDGTLVLTLPPERPGEPATALRYDPHHPRYRELMAHIGNLAPGEEKPVAPWS